MWDDETGRYIIIGLISLPVLFVVLFKKKLFKPRIIRIRSRYRGGYRRFRRRRR